MLWGLYLANAGKVTVSLIKADIGSYPGHVLPPAEFFEIARKILKEKGVQKGLMSDFHVFNCGDDLELLMVHTRGEDDDKIHALAWDVFLECTKFAKQHKLYGAGQDLLSDAFSGNVKGLGPGVAEMEFVERKSDPIIALAGDKTEPAAFNLPLYKIYADPFTAVGLVIDPKQMQGYTFQVLDIHANKVIELSCPKEMYELLALIGATSRYSIKKVYQNGDAPRNERIAAAISSEKLSLIAGQYVGKDDPVALLRAQSGFPAVGEIMEGFTIGHLVAGWNRGSHHGPLVPVSQKDATPTRFDGPPRMVALGFQVGNGKLYGPKDMFEDKSFDLSRQRAFEIADYMRRHGPFEPHRLSPEEMEYTTLPQIIQKLQPRFVPIESSKGKGKRVNAEMEID